MRLPVVLDLVCRSVVLVLCTVGAWMFAASDSFIRDASGDLAFYAAWQLVVGVVERVTFWRGERRREVVQRRLVLVAVVASPRVVLGTVSFVATLADGAWALAVVSGVVTVMTMLTVASPVCSWLYFRPSTSRRRDVEQVPAIGGGG